MPLVRIAPRKGKPREYIRALSDGIHQGLVDAFDIPPDDRFQLVHQHEADEIICDPGYLGVERGDEVVFIHIVAGNWRDTATKQGLYQAIAERLEKDPGIRREDVQIALSQNGRDDWSLGNGIASYVRK